VGTAIRDRLRHARVIGCDKTGARLTTAADGTRMAWEWVPVSDQAVLHRIDPSRGRGVIEDALGAKRPRVWDSDRRSAQQGHADDHQICLAPMACTLGGATCNPPSTPASRCSRRGSAICCAERSPSAGDERR